MNKHLSALAIFVLACSGPAQQGGGGGDDFNDPFFNESSGNETPGDQVHGSARELIGIHGPEQPWSEMTHQDKEFDMIGRFLPIMTETFQESDQTRYASFQCETCHGADMRDRNFQMPNPRLPQVPPAGTPEYRTLANALPESTHFMETEVLPTMQTMLGMGATFTCNGCHPVPGATRTAHP